MALKAKARAIGSSATAHRGAPSARHDGALLYPGPLCGGEVGTTGPAGGIGTMPIPFRQHRDVLSKSPAPAHGLAGHDARQAPSGVAFLFGYFLFGHAKRK